ncbi:MAG TPA: hypothetical protein PLA68_03115 [Panacibacter sp.]|nr:hypothetical protein [Panacibacter sp.]
MKRIFKKTGICLLPFLLIAIISFAAVNDDVFNDSIMAGKPIPVITDSMLNASYSTLAKQFGENKDMPAGYEKQILFALSYFPELARTSITFKIEKSTGGIISTRPFMGSLLMSSSKRSYLVVINDSMEGRAMPTWLNCEINGQIGILGHELSHIIYFSKQTGLGLLGLGVAHISTSYMDHFENKTDSVDIERGLGYQLIAWNQYLQKYFRPMNPDFNPQPYKPGTHERYMSIEHIRQVMAKSKVYSN